MTYCFDCSKFRDGDDLDLCKNKEHDLDFENLYHPPVKYTKKEVDKNNAPDVQTIVKARLGNFLYIIGSKMEGGFKLNFRGFNVILCDNKIRNSDLNLYRPIFDGSVFHKITCHF